jgi:hypothetical protein
LCDTAGYDTPRRLVIDDLLVAVASMHGNAFADDEDDGK